MKQSTIKALKELEQIIDVKINIELIDWNIAWRESQNSKFFETIRLWNDGLARCDIAEKIKISKDTVTDYLVRANEMELITYSIDESRKRGIKSRDNKKNFLNKCGTYIKC